MGFGTQLFTRKFSLFRCTSNTPEGRQTDRNPPRRLVYTDPAPKLGLPAGVFRSFAIADLTPPDLLDSPFRVVRALALGLQPIHYGHGLERVLVPQLQAALAGRAPNCAPIPIC